MKTNRAWRELGESALESASGGLSAAEIQALAALAATCPPGTVPQLGMGTGGLRIQLPNGVGGQLGGGGLSFTCVIPPAPPQQDAGRAGASGAGGAWAAPETSDAGGGERGSEMWSNDGYGELGASSNDAYGQLGSSSDAYGEQGSSNDGYGEQGGANDAYAESATSNSGYGELGSSNDAYAESASSNEGYSNASEGAGGGGGDGGGYSGDAGASGGSSEETA